MNRNKLLILLAVGLIGLCSLAACGEPNDGGKESTTGLGSGGSTAPKETEAVTATPRYDYIDAVVAPDVSITKEDYTNLKLTIPASLKIEDEDVADYIENIRFQYRVAENGSKQVTDKALKLGDDAFIYYKGFTDGKEFEGGSNWDDEEPYQLGLGSGNFIPGFEAALVGIVPNTTSKDKPAEIQVTFPEDYNEELRGKEATFQIVVVHSVQYALPEYNRAFVEERLQYESKKEFYASDAALLTEFEEYVFDTLVTKNATNIENAKIDALWNYFIDKITCKNLPELEMDYYMNAYISEVEYYYDYYSSYAGTEFTDTYPKVDDFAVEYFGVEKGGDWKAEVKTRAEKMVKKDMITHAIGELEGIESVTDEEYKEQIQYWVSYYQGYMTENEIVQSMGEIVLRESAYAEKMQAWLLERVTFTYTDGTPVDGETAEDGAETETTAESAS